MVKEEVERVSSEVSLSPKDLMHEEPKLTLLGNMRISSPFGVIIYLGF